MKTNKKILILLILVVLAVCCVTLVSCGGDDDDDNRVTITYYMTEYSAPMTTSVEAGTSFNFTHLPEREHYTFLGMYDTQGTQVVDASGKGTVVLSSAVTLYARWNPATYTFYFDSNGGEILYGGESFSAKYGSQLNFTIPMVEKEGYDFLGWYCNYSQITTANEFVSGAEVFDTDNYEINDGKVYLTAKFEIKQLKVTFDFNDGINEERSVYVPYGNEIPSESIPTCDTGSKEIVGWSVLAGNSQSFEGVITEDITLYPIWKSYKIIEFYTDTNATSPEENLKVYEGEQLTPYTPEKAGYEFDGWYASTLFSGNPENTIHYNLGTKKLYAKWNLVYYTLTYVTNNGTVIGGGEYTIESEFELPALEKENFTFIGWCASEDLSDQPMTTLKKGTHGITTLYAKYKGDDKTVVMDAGEGTLHNNSKTVEYYQKYTLPVPKYDGYEFRGWYLGEGEDAVQLTGEDGVSLGIWNILDETTTLYAKYEPKRYVNVTPSIEQAGSFTVDEYYVAGDEVTLSANANTGYSIVGWFVGGEQVSNSSEYTFVMGEADVNIELRFKPNEYTVTFDADGGICRATSSTVSYKENFEFPIAFKQGYMFLGWQYNGNLITDSDGDGISVWEFTVDNVNLTAVYEVDESGATMVYDVDSLLAIANNPSGYYVLVEDINLAGVTWTPFEFSGTLFGNDCTISNLTLYSTSGDLGMFTKIKGTVKDLNFENITVESASYERVSVGGLCAVLEGGSISGIEVRGTVSGDFCRVGGIVGSMSSGTVENCKNYATVYSETYESDVSAGGVVAYLTNNGSVTECENHGAVSIGHHSGGVIGICSVSSVSDLTNYGEVEGKEHVGGCIGYFGLTGSYTVGNMKNEGTVSGERKVGGVIGSFMNEATWSSNDYTYNIKITKLTNTGTVTATDTYVGGCIGRLYAAITGSYSDGSAIVTATNLKNDANVTGKTYVGGLVGYATSDNGSSQIMGSASSGVITAEAYIGGLAGKLENIKLIESSNVGTVINATSYVIDGTYYKACVGGYVGLGYYVENCHNTIDITYTERGSYVGGIAGALSSSIQNCSNTADITADDASYVGGLVGEINCTGSYNVVQLTNSGNVSGVDRVGGCIGYFGNDASWSSNDSTYNVKITKLTNTGSVTATGSYVGGCIGRLYAAITGSYSDGSVIVTASNLRSNANVTGKTYVGGLVGYAYSDNGSSQIMASASSGVITAEAYIGGLAGQLENVKLIESSNEGSVINATYYTTDSTTYFAYVGGYVGYGYYIENCHNAVNITYTERGIYVGGIAGRILNSIQNCSNTADITAQNASYVGGIVGQLCCTGSYSVTKLTNSGSISGVNRVGGLMGSFSNEATWGSNDSTYNVQINKLTNTGTVTATGSFVGGCIGRLGATITGSYSDGSVIITASNLENNADVTGKTYVGGLIGDAYTDNGSSQIMGSASSGVITAEAYIGGLAGQLENVKLIESSNEGSTVNATYYVIDGSTYHSYVGGYVGRGYYVENCHNAVEITYTECGIYVGGIAGYLTNAAQNCSNTANITAQNASYVGGIVGKLSCPGSYSIIDLTNSGNISGIDCVGGLIGYLSNEATWGSNDSTYSLKFNKLTNTGEVTATGTNVAGCIGQLGATITGSYSDGSVIITATDINNSGNVSGVGNVGGLIGYVYTDNASSSMTDFECTGTVNGVDTATADEATLPSLLIGASSNFTLK